MWPQADHAAAATAAAAEDVTAGRTSPQPDTPASDIAALLVPLIGAPCLLKVEGWWTYELCVGRHVRQFHRDQNGNTGRVLFGRCRTGPVP